MPFHLQCHFHRNIFFIFLKDILYCLRYQRDNVRLCKNLTYCNNVFINFQKQSNKLTGLKLKRWYLFKVTKITSNLSSPYFDPNVFLESTLKLQWLKQGAFIRINETRPVTMAVFNLTIQEKSKLSNNNTIIANCRVYTSDDEQLWRTV